MHTLRDKNGVSGFAKRSESEYDAFGAGHSSTSISAALGMAVARDRQNKPNHCVAVIGDGAITGGMAYEAMNCAAYLDSRLIVILNDNDQVWQASEAWRLKVVPMCSARFCVWSGHKSLPHDEPS